MLPEEINYTLLQNTLKEEKPEILEKIFGNLQWRCSKGQTLKEALEKTCEQTSAKISTPTFRIATLLGVFIPQYNYVENGEEFIVYNEQDEVSDEPTK